MEAETPSSLDYRIGAAGTYTVQATYSGDSNYNGATGSTVLTITTSTPVLTWATPAAITYGTALSATQLNASSSGLAGTFAYTPAAGTILAAGSQTLSVTFTPTDLVDYTVQNRNSHTARQQSSPNGYA